MSEYEPVDPDTQAKQDAILRAAVEESLALTTDEPIMVTGFVVYATYTTAEDLDLNRTAYCAYLPGGQPLHISMGLAVMLADYVKEVAADD